MLIYKILIFDFFVIFRNWFFENVPRGIMQPKVYIADIIICSKDPQKS